MKFRSQHLSSFKYCVSVEKSLLRIRNLYIWLYAVLFVIAYQVSAVLN